MSMIGKSLIHYEISADLGKGGMGEVYQAKDTKLGRDVAIKVLPEEFALDTDRVARFQREAKLLASLNHPNIAAIYGLEESDDTHFLVMELIEGDTLRDRIKSGPIPVEEALKLALQMAEALEVAHEKGVIHRDLKPANIKVTPDGKVKVLDFGLAKAYVGDQENLSPMDSPTLSIAGTQQGVILGTAAYMSPEQARGKPVDKRADIWAFGVVLFEMLTGKAAFQGEDVSETLASVIKGDSNLGLLPANIHPRVREVITRCLQKEQKKRYRDIGDSKYEIEQVLSDSSGVFVQPSAIAKPRKKLRVGIPWVLAAVALALIIAGVAVWMLKPTEPRQIIRFDYELPESQQFSSLNLWKLTVSPDGKKFAYSTPTGLYLRSLDELTAKHIAGTEESVQNPFFSFDGDWIGYYSVNDRQLKKISINGGVPIILCDVSQLIGAWWGADNTIVYGQSSGDIMRVSANSGTPESLIKMESEALIIPQVLPDGKSVLYRRGINPRQSTIMVQSLESGESKELFAGISARYLPTGHIVYWLLNGHYAVPFDAYKLEVTGGPVPVVLGADEVAISDAGTMVYIPQWYSTSSEGASGPQRTLVWVDRKGQEEPLDAPPNAYMFPKISPDGTKVALNIPISDQADIWIWDLIRKTRSRLTRDEAYDGVPLWTSDGKRIFFVSNRGGSPNIYWKSADGTGEVEQLGSLTTSAIFPSSWSNDGNSLIFNEQQGETGYDISVMSIEGDYTSNPLLQEEFAECNPQVSPDGRWLAYMSYESEQPEIYVRPFPDVHSGKLQISTSGGMEPRWSPDGKELFYRNPSGDAMMVVDIETEPVFEAGIPKELFRGPYYYYMGHNWDIHPDGKRFLMVKQPERLAEESTEESAATEPRKIIVVTNWFEELKERVPID
jgi:serine/threonine-protein kinase